MRRRLVQLWAGVVAGATLAAAGSLTHFYASAGPLSSADQSLLEMQRMGYPPNLQAAEEQLNSGTVAIRDSATGSVVATGIYVESSLEPGKPPTFASLLHAGIKEVLGDGGSSSYAALFFAPLRDVKSPTVRVDTATAQLNGTVVSTSAAFGLAAIVATASQSQLSALVPPPSMAGYPLSAARLSLLILRRDPDEQPGPAGFVPTSGGIRNGEAWCDTPVSGADSGAPVGYVAPSGTLYLVGLAMPSPARGQCSVLGAWDIAEFANALEQPSAPAGSHLEPFLGVSVQGTAVGAYVTSVSQESPAAAVGLAAGDVILRIGGEPVRTLSTLRTVLRKFRPGTIQPVTFTRGKAVFTIPVMLAGIPAADESP